MQNIEFGVVTQKTIINVEEGYPLKTFAPVDENGEIANNGDAYGIVIDALGIGEVKQLVVMTAGCIDKICAEQHYGESYSAEAISALENIVIFDNHKIGGGGGGGMMVVKATYNEDDESYTVDKTFEEICNALPNVVVDVYDVPYRFESLADKVLYFGSTFFDIDEGRITQIQYNGLQIESNNIVTETYGEKNF